MIYTHRLRFYSLLSFLLLILDPFFHFSSSISTLILDSRGFSVISTRCHHESYKNALFHSLRLPWLGTFSVSAQLWPLPLTSLIPRVLVWEQANKSLCENKHHLVHKIPPKPNTVALQKPGKWWWLPSFHLVKQMCAWEELCPLHLSLWNLWYCL